MRRRRLLIVALVLAVAGGVAVAVAQVGVQQGRISPQQALLNNVASIRLQIGPVLTRGRGTGGNPELGRKAARRGDIEIRNLTFAYDQHPVLRDVTLHVRPGETIGIVGRTGSGKSTLLSLITRTFEPPPGTIFID